MAKDVLKRRIAEALSHASSRDALATILRDVSGEEHPALPSAAVVELPAPLLVPPAAAPEHVDCESAARVTSDMGAAEPNLAAPADRESVPATARGARDGHASPDAEPLPDADVARVLQEAADDVAESEADGTPAGAAPEDASIDDTSLQAILDNVKDGIVTVDVDGRVLSVNSAAARLFAGSAEAMLDRPIASLIPALDPADGGLATLAERSDDTIVDLSPTLLEGLRADGGSFMAEVTVSAAARRGYEFYVLCMRDVTERQQNEQALRDSEARYRALVENAPEAILVFDVDAERFIDANENAAKLFKYTREQLLEVGPRAISPVTQSDGLPSFGLVRGYVDRALKGCSPVFEWLHVNADGEEIPCEVRFIRLPSSNRRLIRASVIDITSRRRADVLAYGERRVLELIAANAPLERTLQAVVRLVEQMYPELHAALMLLAPDRTRLTLAACGSLPPALEDALTEVLARRDSCACTSAVDLGRQVVVRDMLKDPLWAGLRGVVESCGVRACCSTPIVTAGDRIHGTLAVYWSAQRGPTTEELDLVTRLTQLAGIAIRRKQDEAALRDSEARYRGLFDNVVDGVFQTTVEGELLSINPALMRMLGLPPDEPLDGLNIVDFYADPRDRERLLAAVSSSGTVRDFEYRLQRRGGSTIIVVENSRLVRDDEGRALYLEGTITDITQRKAAERALAREKERAQVTLKSIGDAVVTTDATGLIDYLNPVAEQLTGWKRHDAQGKRIEEVIQLTDEETGEPVEPPVLRCLAEGRTLAAAANVVLWHREGSSLAIQDSAAPIQDRSGHMIGAVMVFHDVSQERQLHRKLTYYASHDSLTGFINRREFEERLSAAVRAVQHDGAVPYALLYLDLDQFKVVNDT
ncbi:MAG: PAS domain S-box protein, partial [Gammaproteobacteria bacterium]|nr:PAS domain S-box protein [Gammaproteobacteria bacterium]